MSERKESRHRGSRGRGGYRGRRSSRSGSRYSSRDKTEQRSAPSVDVSTLGNVRMYGDQMGDGAVQLSFTLPVPKCDEAKVAALQFAQKMNLTKPSVVHMEAIDDRFTFFVVYAQSEIEVDMSAIEVPKLDFPHFSFDEVNDRLKSQFDRKLVVLGACIGTDAHTVGIDAIFNMKGYMGDYGLERYPCFEAVNLRAQVDTKELCQAVIKHQADAVLVSRVVTQRDSHIVEFKKFLEELSQETSVPKHLVKICGGPRMSHKEAADIGYDAGFGPGTLPSHVASYIMTELTERLEDNS